MAYHKKSSTYKIRDLHLPIFKDGLPPSKSLSMDDYLRFVDFNLKYMVDIKESRKRSKAMRVNVPFKI